MTYKRQRIRDPLHNLIDFEANEFENTIWRVIQTRPFQRLRRIKQLGFSELVYPGATHTRFAHSVGVFHTARQLMHVVWRHLGNDIKKSKVDVALAAALVHDLGHGPFSHAFEDVGKKLGLKMADHEKVSDSLIREGEVSEVLNSLGAGFASDVADMVKNAGPVTIYTAVVSSQFDADRLDYMQRDRLMTGTHNGAIDFRWLLSNLQVDEVQYGVDEESVGSIATFVLGPKAAYAAETYLLSLFQLYPTVYFHKATRGAEKLYSELLMRVIELVNDGDISSTGLPDGHPLVVFAKNPEPIDHVLALDDTVIWGALHLMAGAKDGAISGLAIRLRDRRLFKCVDVREKVGQQLEDRPDQIDRCCAAIEERFFEWQEANGVKPRLLIDKATREPYRHFQESKGPVNQIMIKTSDTSLRDVAKLSKVVAAIQTFKLLRVYVSQEDKDAKKFVDDAISAEVHNASHR